MPYGLPRRGVLPRGPSPCPRLIWHGDAASTTINILTDARIRTGDVLLASFASQQRAGSLPTISGGGARWRNLAWVGNPAGAQIDIGLWVGIIGTTPGSSVTINYTNSGVIGVSLFRGLIGADLHVVAASNSGGGITPGTLHAHKGGIAYFVAGNRPSFTQLPYGAIELMRGTNSANHCAGYNMRPSADDQVAQFIGGSDNAAAIGAVII